MSLEREAKREKRLAVIAAAREAQREKDLDRLDELEDEHGEAQVTSFDVSFDSVSERDNHTTMVIVRAPSGVEQKRLRDMLKKDQGKAILVLGAACRLYPDDETYKGMVSRFPGIEDTAGVEAAKLGDGKKARLGKD